MIKSTNERIKAFFNWARDQVGFVSRIRIEPVTDKFEIGPPLHVYQKLILLSVLDSLAGVRFDYRRYPRLNQRNQERFVRLVKEYTSWVYVVKVIQTRKPIS
jgi:hypothetical protein